MSLILLRSKDGVIKATAFAAGATTVRVLQYILFGYVFGEAVSKSSESAFDFVTATLLLVAGVFLLVTGFKTWFKEVDPDAPPPQWMTKLGNVSAPMAFGMAVLMMLLAMKQWVFTLSAIAVIDEARMGTVVSAVVYLAFVLAAQSMMIAPIIASAIAPVRSARMVASMLQWLERNTRLITITVSVIVGTWFLTRGATGLMSHSNGVLIPATN
jgi:hypothetical protein